MLIGEGEGVLPPPLFVMDKLLSDTAEDQTGNSDWYTNTTVEEDVSTTSCCNESCPEPVDVTVNITNLNVGTASGEGQVETEEFQEPGDIAVGGAFVDLANLMIAGYDIKAFRNGVRQADADFSTSTEGLITRVTFVDLFVAEDLIAIEYAYETA